MKGGGLRVTVATASIEGEKACAALGAAAPPRDCAVLALAPALTDWDRQTVPWRGVTGRGTAEAEAMRAGGSVAAFEDVARNYTDARGTARVQNAAAIPSFKRWLAGLDTEVMRLACRRVSVFPDDMIAGEEFARARAEEARVGAALGMGCPQ